ncbi:hypothetical protein [Arthrobacter zhangbolii]|nr:hypothetical protein [Arthrobacter zhangbolii]
MPRQRKPAKPSAALLPSRAGPWPQRRWDDGNDDDDGQRRRDMA